MGKKSDGTLELLHAEFQRRRSEQSGRIASVRSRSAGVLGASGLAVTLVTTLSDNGWYVIGIFGYLLSTVYAVKSMRITSGNGTTPLGLLKTLYGKGPDFARKVIVRNLGKELTDNEAMLKTVGHSTSVALGWFIAGTALTFFVAFVAALLQVEWRR